MTLAQKFRQDMSDQGNRLAYEMGQEKANLGGYH